MRRAPRQILGMILVKSLILFNSERATPIRECNLRKVPFVPTTKPLYDMLNLFQEGRGQTPPPGILNDLWGGLWWGAGT